MVLKIAKALRHLHREEEGFTLIELLIVIAILAVLAAIAIPLVANRINDARISADMANVKALQGAVDLYYLDENAYPTEATFIADLKTAGYLLDDVKCPFPGTTGAGYTLDIDPKGVGKVTSDNAGKWTSP